MAKKKLRSRVTEEDSRNQSGTGPDRGKTRADVPSTQANKAATGKQTSNKGRSASH